MIICRLLASFLIYILELINFYIVLFFDYPMVRVTKLTQLVEETVVVARSGRAVAGLGAMLTNVEKANAPEIYGRLVAKQHISESSPVTAEIIEKRRKRKISVTEAVKKFIRQYPKESLPLQEIMKEREEFSSTLIGYGLKEEQDLDAGYYVGLIKRIAGISESEAGVLYHGVLVPMMNRTDKEKKKGLIEYKIK
jgi:hypothetical protein